MISHLQGKHVTVCDLCEMTKVVTSAYETKDRNKMWKSRENMCDLCKFFWKWIERKLWFKQVLLKFVILL